METKVCSLDGCERRAVARTWCRAHWKHWRRWGDPLLNAPPRVKRPVDERFWEKVERGPECWEWTASKDELGYGFFRVAMGESMRKAHRVAWELAFGVIPPGLTVCHACDNPSCVRPEHLFVGTHQANMADRNAKGRTTIGRTGHHGEGSGRAAKLTLEQVREIRARYAAGGISQRELGEIYGIAQTQVGRIVRRARWAHDD